MTTTRVLRSAPATLERRFYLGEEPQESSTTVTVTVTDANGADVASGDATPAGTGYTFVLPGQAQLGSLTATWSATIAGTAVEVADLVEVAGGFYFTLADGRASDPSLKDTVKYPTARLAAVRQEVEEECEGITQRAWVPRYRRVLLDGTGTPDMVLPDGGDEWRAGIRLRGVRAVRSASVAPRTGQPPVALSAGELAALAVMRDGTLRRTDGRVWTEGVGNVVLEYEYGSDAPPADLRSAALLRFRWLATKPHSGIPDRATSFSAAEGGVYELATAGADRTGIPEVDAAYLRYGRGGGSGGGDGADGDRPTPASRPLNFDPSWNSLFHGGPR
ncbi:hypothetical protein [Nonomuraea sp. NPDC050202]|uniref:hypothetical protein n=1 Tax=Nonomuraea sp. NPDC050202 TaxID=3155035 RepID=UPI0033C7D4B6